MIAAAAARTDSDVSCGELSDDADKDEEEPDQQRAGGRTSRGRATTSAAAQWAGASAQGGSDVHLNRDFAADALLDGDYQSGRNRRGRIATTAARPPLPPRRLGSGRRARSAASLAYAEVTWSSSSSSSSEDEKGCRDQEGLCTAAAPHRGRAVKNGRLRRGRLSIAHIASVFLSPFVSSLYMLFFFRLSFLFTCSPCVCCCLSVIDFLYILACRYCTVRATSPLCHALRKLRSRAPEHTQLRPILPIHTKRWIPKRKQPPAQLGPQSGNKRKASTHLRQPRWGQNKRKAAQMRPQ